MDVILDGYIYYLQKVGGISRIFNEILPIICELDDAFSFKVLMHARKSDFSEKIEQILIPNLEKYLRLKKLRRDFSPILNDFLVSQKIKQTKNKIFHSTYYRSLTSWQGKQICSVYDLIYERYADTFPDSHDVIHLKAQAFKQSDRLLCISRTTKEDLIYYYNIPGEKIFISPLACSDQFKPVGSAQINFHMGTPFILYLGGRSTYKGFADLVKAYSQWNLRHDLNLVVIGKEWTKQEAETIFNAGIKDRVLLLDKINDHQLCDLYNQARAFVYPSHYEGFGIPLLEAMACGCPIIASDIPSTREVAGNIPFYFEVTNPESLRNSLATCVENNARNTEQVKAGLKWAKQYSWKKTAQSFMDAYHSF